MLASSTITTLRQQLVAGEITPRDIILDLAKAIESRNTSLGAYLSWDIDSALAEADKADTSSPLGGIPIAIKDNINVTGQPCTCGSRILAENYTAPYDAGAIQRLRAGGAIPFGRLNMDEFAMGSSTENSALGVTRNPRDLERVPGGSSGGSASAVAGDLAIAALGSDTGGSIRQPAALCGCVGIKPTYGRISRYGLVAFASSLDQIGPLTKTVADSALLLNHLCGHDPRDSTSLNVETPDFTASHSERTSRACASACPRNTTSTAFTPASRPVCRPPFVSWSPWGRSLRKSACRTPSLASPPTMCSPRRRLPPTSPASMACATATAVPARQI
jgi:aspartyl-tRNA(Asn)/glutamyl-tRNA(Gln) amidotransferase subunit A